jgi:deazaflavin-dependent oxidoreductase (nitroreductase family)
VVPREARLNALARAFYLFSGRLTTLRIAGVRPVAASHALWYRWLRGRLVGRAIAPVVLLTTTGRRSGKSRTTPLFGIRDGDAVVVVGSNAGGDDHPDWYRNLRAQPVATVQVGGDVRSVRARDADPVERDRLWPLLDGVYAGYRIYREVAGREIPIVILEPTATTPEVHPSH